jgi:hypothetical protein
MELSKNTYPGHAANNTKVSVPWLLIASDPGKFLDPIYLPPGVELREISKMKSDQLQACYAHWYKRQEHGDPSFIFKHVDPSDVRTPGRKRKQKAHNHDDSGDEEDIPTAPPSPEPMSESK